MKKRLSKWLQSIPLRLWCLWMGLDFKCFYGAALCGQIFSKEYLVEKLDECWIQTYGYGVGPAYEIGKFLTEE